jgi:hypothetical protein
VNLSVECESKEIPAPRPPAVGRRGVRPLIIERKEVIMQSENKIPKMFTDATLEYERSELKTKLRDISKSRGDAENGINVYKECRNRLKTELIQYELQHREAIRQEIAEWPGLIPTGSIYSYDVKWRREEIYELNDKITSLSKEVEQYKRDSAKYSARLEDIDELLKMTATQRAEKHYQLLLGTKDARSKSANSREFSDLARKFREMEGYKDTEALARECDELADNERRKEEEQRRREEEEQRKREEEQRRRDEERRKREAEEYRMEQEEKYKKLLERKNNAKTEEEYQDLAREFQYLGYYKDSKTLADECEKKYQSLVDIRREEEAKKRREEEKKRKLKELVNNITNTLIVTLICAIVGVFLAAQLIKEDEGLAVAVCGLGGIVIGAIGMLIGRYNSGENGPINGHVCCLGPIIGVALGMVASFIASPWGIYISGGLLGCYIGMAIVSRKHGWWG